MPSAQWRPPGPRAGPAAALPQARASRCRARRAPPGPARASSAAPPAARGAERGPPEWRRSPSSEQHPKPSSSLCWSPRSELRPPPAPGSAAQPGATRPPPLGCGRLPAAPNPGCPPSPPPGSAPPPRSRPRGTSVRPGSSFGIGTLCARLATPPRARVLAPRFWEPALERFPGHTLSSSRATSAW